MRKMSKALVKAKKCSHKKQSRIPFLLGILFILLSIEQRDLIQARLQGKARPTNFFETMVYLERRPSQNSLKTEVFHKLNKSYRVFHRKDMPNYPDKL